ncbi:MAG: acyl carrier protein [Sandaracinaceae bacterium]|nr:acyl carrier protein [Sandaracinaceae bacterium]
MTRDEVIARLRAHLGDLVGDAADDLGIDQDIRDELDIDSMDFLQVVRAVHADLGVEIPEVDYRLLPTLDAFATYVLERL